MVFVSCQLWMHERPSAVGESARPVAIGPPERRWPEAQMPLAVLVTVVALWGQ
jgi:hypothetical protein